jgi:hypothetical protein
MVRSAWQRPNIGRTNREVHVRFLGAREDAISLRASDPPEAGGHFREIKKIATISIQVTRIKFVKWYGRTPC